MQSAATSPATSLWAYSSSGGVDSAGLVALASRVRPPDADPLVTLTVTFDEREYSESAPAQQVSQRFRTCHREIRVTAADFQAEFPAFLRAMDQPTNDGINTYFISKAARQAGLTVVLSGLGGDEVFWGYKHYRWLAHAGWLTASPAPVRRLLAYSGQQWGRLRGRDRWMRTAYLKGAPSNDRAYLAMRGFFAPDQAARLLGINRAEMDATIEEQFGESPATGKPNPSGVNYLEIKRYLHDQLLRDTDVFSMAHSIEARVPVSRPCPGGAPVARGAVPEARQDREQAPAGARRGRSIAAPGRLPPKERLRLPDGSLDAHMHPGTARNRGLRFLGPRSGARMLERFLRGTPALVAALVAGGAGSAELSTAAEASIRHFESGSAMVTHRKTAPLTPRASSHLDMVRGVSALAVMVGHIRGLFFLDYRDLASRSPVVTFLYAVTGLGHQAVMVFFVLSGFFIGGGVLASLNNWSWKRYLVDPLAAASTSCFCQLWC